MNVRKPVDYSDMFKALDALMLASLPQMELYCKIGKLVSSRPEKGVAVAAAEYLGKNKQPPGGKSKKSDNGIREPISKIWK